MEHVNHPSHYNTGKIEVIDFIEDKSLNFNRGNVVKYVVRAGLKNKETEIEDLRKAKFYIEHEITSVAKEKVKKEMENKSTVYTVEIKE